MAIIYKNESIPEQFWYDEPSFKRMYGMNSPYIKFDHLEGPLTKNLSLQYEKNGGRLPNGVVSRGTDYRNNSGFDEGYKLSYTYSPQKENPDWIINAFLGKERAFGEDIRKRGVEYVNLDGRQNAASHIAYEHSKSGNIPINNYNIGGKIGNTDVSLDYTKVGDIAKSYGIGIKGRYGKSGDLMFKASKNNRGNYSLMGMYGRKF